MTELSDAHAMAIERSCAVTAVALSDKPRGMTGGGCGRRRSSCRKRLVRESVG